MLAEDRGDERAAVIATGVQIGALGALGQSERIGVLALEGLRRAELTGNARLISAALICWCSAYTFQLEDPDFAASLEVLERYDIASGSGTMNDMWLDIYRGEALLGLGRPGAIQYLVRGARSADRLGNPQALDQALREIAIVAADAGLVPQARMLADYAETVLREYRGSHGGLWIEARLDRALGSGRADSPHPAHAHRRDIMELVDALETALAHNGARDGRSDEAFGHVVSAPDVVGDSIARDQRD